MATDGVKIIDGDLAHDTYWGIMDLYDSDADIETIKKEFPFVRENYNDDFDHEIFVTAYALAFWEMGQMTDKILSEVKSVIDKGACVKVWSEDSNPKEGKARQKELEKFWKKVSQANTKIRKRKKFRKITNLYFQANDLLTFQLSDNNYYAVVCAQVNQYRGECNYILIPSTYKGKSKPTVRDLYDCSLLGRRISSGYHPDITKEQQLAVEKIWKLYPDKTNFFFGVVQRGVPHKAFINFKNKFEKVGQLVIKESFKRIGSLSYESNFDRFESTFSDLDKEIKIFGYEKFPVKVLCEL